MNAQQLLYTKRNFLEIETKYDANNIDRVQFKSLLRSYLPDSFLYVESGDRYYVKSESEFLRYRMPPGNGDNRAELTFKKKHTNQNNNVRTEVNLRIDLNDLDVVHAFCEGLGYEFNFAIYKMCDIYYFHDANVVLYSVIDDVGGTASFLEIEVKEDLNINESEAWEIIVKYEKMLNPLGINAQKRKKLSLFEIYRND